MTGPKPADLRSSVLATLAFFDMFDCPLTLLEVRRFLYDPSGRGGGVGPSLAGVVSALAGPGIEQTGGYYFLAGRRSILATRLRRFRLVEKKFRKARRLAWWASFLPSVRLIAVCNSLALSSADAASDIDLFLVCRPGTLWITRLLIAGPLRLFRQTPNHKYGHTDKFCLTFFLSDDRLEIGRLALPGGDPYFHYWVSSLVPVFDEGGILARFIGANDWVRRYLPGTYGVQTDRQRAVPARGRNRRTWALKALTRLEPAARWIQERWMPRFIADMANKDSRVILSRDILKFHTNDRREQFRKDFEGRLAGLGVTV